MLFFRARRCSSRRGQRIGNRLCGKGLVLPIRESAYQHHEAFEEYGGQRCAVLRFYPGLNISPPAGAFPFGGSLLVGAVRRVAVSI